MKKYVYDIQNVQTPVCTKYTVTSAAVLEHILKSNTGATVIITISSGTLTVKYRGSSTGTFKLVPYGTAGVFSSDFTFSVGKVYSLECTASNTAVVEIVE